MYRYGNISRIPLDREKNVTTSISPVKSTIMYAQKSFHHDIFFILLPGPGNRGIPVPSTPFL
jgi:hypothetical protein